MSEIKRGKRPLLSGFDKWALLIVILILGYYFAAKMGCPVTKVEEKVEWVEH